MSEEIEKSSIKPYAIERTVVNNIPAVPSEFSLPTSEQRLIVGATPKTELDEGKSGLEVISLVEFPRTKEGAILYKGRPIDGSLQAIIVDPLVPLNFDEGTGFKGLRKGEVVLSDKLLKRFGKEPSFNIGLDQDGKLLIENTDPSNPVNVLRKVPKTTTEEVPAVGTHDSAESAQRLMGLEEVAPTADVIEAEIEAKETSEEMLEEIQEHLGETAAEATVGEIEDSQVAAELEVDEKSELSDTQPEVVETRTLFNDQEKRAVTTFIEHVALYAENHRKDFSPEEAHYHQDRYVMKQLVSATERFRSGEIGSEAYALLAGAFIGSFNKAKSFDDALKLIDETDVLSRDEINTLEGRFHTLGLIAGRMDDDSEVDKVRYISSLEEEAGTRIDRSSSDRLDRTALVTYGLVAGISTQMKDGYTAGYKRNGIIDYISKIKK